MWSTFKEICLLIILWPIVCIIFKCTIWLFVVTFVVVVFKVVTLLLCCCPKIQKKTNNVKAINFFALCTYYFLGEASLFQRDLHSTHDEIIHQYSNVFTARVHRVMSAPKTEPRRVYQQKVNLFFHVIRVPGNGSFPFLIGCPKYLDTHV